MTNTRMFALANTDGGAKIPVLLTEYDPKRFSLLAPASLPDARPASRFVPSPRRCRFAATAEGGKRIVVLHKPPTGINAFDPLCICGPKKGRPVCGRTMKRRLFIIIGTIVLAGLPLPVQASVGGCTKTLFAGALFFGVTGVAAGIAGLLKARSFRTSPGALRQLGVRDHIKTLVLEGGLLALVAAGSLLMSGSIKAAIIGLGGGFSTALGEMLGCLQHCGLLGPFVMLLVLFPAYFYPVFRWNLGLVRKATGPTFGDRQKERRKAAGFSVMTPALLMSVMVIYAGIV